MFFLSPYFWIALAGFFVVGYVTGCSGERDAKLKVEAAWEADKKQRLATLERINNERQAAVKAVQYEADKRAAKDREAFRALSARTDAISRELVQLRIDNALLERLRDAVRTANAEATGTPAGTPKDPAPVTGDTSGLALANWFNQVALQYKECRDEVIAWNHFWDTQVAIR